MFANAALQIRRTGLSLTLRPSLANLSRMSKIIGSCMVAAALFLTASVVAEQPTPASASSAKEMWEGRFSQCSYNAVASALDFFYGQPGHVADKSQFEKDAFYNPLKLAGYEPYFGWGPWTSYMVGSGKMVWNGQPVVDLKSERFSLRPQAQPEIKGRVIVVRYAPGERDALRQKLLKELARGPVVMWTPYAAALDGPFFPPWHHVTRLDDQTDIVPFGLGMTHSVTLFLHSGAPDNDSVEVTDCSAKNGVYTTDPDTIVSTAAAMTAYVRMKPPDGKSIFDNGFSGIKDDEYNVVFFQETAALK
jgi:hypothetical protein